MTLIRLSASGPRLGRPVPVADYTGRTVHGWLVLERAEGRANRQYYRVQCVGCKAEAVKSSGALSTASHRERIGRPGGGLILRDSGTKSLKRLEKFSASKADLKRLGLSK